MDLAGGSVAAAARHDEAAPVLVRHADAEARQQVQRDGHVGFGDQFALHLDDDVLRLADQGQRQQQGTEELAGDVATHADRPAGVQRSARLALHAQRRVARLAQVDDVAAQRAQGIDQVADRPLVHARHARQLEAPALRRGEQRQRGRQRTHGGAGVAEEQRGLRHWQPAAQAVDAQRTARGRLHIAAQRTQRLEHDARVVRLQRLVHQRAALGQRGQQQHAVGNALRSRQPHRAGGNAQRRNVEKGNVVHVAAARD